MTDKGYFDFFSQENNEFWDLDDDIILQKLTTGDDEILFQDFRNDIHKEKGENVEKKKKNECDNIEKVNENNLNVQNENMNSGNNNIESENEERNI